MMTLVEGSTLTQAAATAIPWRDWPRPERVPRSEQLAAAADGARLLYASGSREVWLFGSIAKNRRLGVHSDFDFATSGLPSAVYLNCLGTLLQALPLPVDIVELESASAMFRERILTEGMLLPHENPPG